MMKRGILLMVGAAVTGTVLAAGAGKITDETEKAQASQMLSRKDAVRALVIKWGPSASRAQGMNVYEWAYNMVPLFHTANVGNLNHALTAKTYPEMTSYLVGSQPATSRNLPDGITPQSLGSLTSDLVFTPLASCIIVDTRPSSGGGGPFIAGAVRHFKASGVSFSSQGGSNTNCGIPVGIGSLLVSVSAISPTTAGYFRLWPFNTPQPLASNISYTASQNNQNEIVMATSVGLANDFSVYSSGGSNLVVNVLGYFAAPVATALDCVSVTLADTSVAAGATFNLSIPACAAGYTTTGAGCRTPGFADVNWAINGLYSGGGAFCAGKSIIASSTTVGGARRCCRVPGR